MAKAAELHKQFDLKARLRDGSGPIDVLSTIRDVGIMVLFRPLEGLLGAYVPTPSAAGMLVTTQRDHHVQRFTAAHELGHHVCGHSAPSLDVSVGFVARGEKDGYDAQEVEADAFAAEFLLPKWLITAHARRQHWSLPDLSRPDVVYQLSLRLAASYSATCWALLAADYVPLKVAQQLAKLPPRLSKQRAMPDFQPDNWYGDVWLMSERDAGVQIVGSPDDYLVFNLEEHAAGGYEWGFDALNEAPLEVRHDQRKHDVPLVYGAPVTRRVVLQGNAISQTVVRLDERRPWEADENALKSLELRLALLGKEPVGMVRPERFISA
ncbi:ImmA/IrrE family metallo-endopeptidase [Roseateles sp. DC23W]|uniref:ImmA/IrrE family metallo-endopeptidase n=1 Tax=Pelomonas dachongensis TaxID=3299029 RepID=A0ABW7EHP3_9BURK